MDIAQTRLRSQHISGNKRATPEDVVRSLGAVQAQDYGHVLWAIGLRMPDATVEDVAGALRDGRILRTWAMRGTLHVIGSEDAKWMLALLAQRVVARLTPKIWQYHGTDMAMMDLARETFIEALSGGRVLPRATMIRLLQDVGIPNDKQQSYFIFGYLCQTGVLCVGPPQGREQTFALLDEWAPQQRKLDNEESLVVLAERFFTSHGPATIADFANWAGIKMSEAKFGLEPIKDSLESFAVDGNEYWLAEGSEPGSGTFLLPGYDEFLIGYKDRGASFTKYGQTPISTYNGMFYATIIDDGQVVGLWKRSMRKTRVDLDLHPIAPLDLASVTKHAEELGRFLGKTITMTDKGSLMVASTGTWDRSNRGGQTRALDT